MKVIRDENGRERINAATQETEEYELRRFVWEDPETMIPAQ